MTLHRDEKRPTAAATYRVTYYALVSESETSASKYQSRDQIIITQAMAVSFDRSE